MIRPFPEDFSFTHPSGMDNPFRYSPHPLVQKAAEMLIREIDSSEKNEVAAELSGLEVDDALGVEHLSHISALEVEVRARAATRIATEGNRLTCHYPVASLDQTLGEVSVVGLDAVVVTNNNECSIARIGRLREAHTTIKSGADGVAHLQRNVYAVVVLATTHTIA